MKLAAVGDNCVDQYDKLGKQYPGGNPVNVSVYFVRMGGEASYTGAVGTDKAGEVLIQRLKEKGVDASHVHVREGSTAVTHVDLVDGERVFGDYDEGVMADFKLTDEDIDFLCSQDMVVSGLWGKIEHDLGKIRARGVPVAFDFATKWDDPVLKVAIDNVDYAFFASDDGDTPELRAFMKKMHAHGAKLVVVTLGDKGSIAYDGRDFTVGGIVPCHVVDTMGAGDSFIAGFLYGILQKKPVAECMHMGAANSSVTLEYNGAW